MYNQKTIIWNWTVFNNSSNINCSWGHEVISFTASCVSQSAPPPILACEQLSLTSNQDTVPCYRLTCLPVEWFKQVFQFSLAFHKTPNILLPLICVCLQKWMRLNIKYTVSAQLTVEYMSKRISQLSHAVLFVWHSVPTFWEIGLCFLYLLSNLLKDTSAAAHCNFSLHFLFWQAYS